ncbi:Do family serine endopeptidase [Uliginosibacterium sp. H3]|uniref:Do family serine endopeptidase n=1 Tax=Uliginosibacterium silvisoli TaxID=3114758 RepID=A0ABU6K538_9RHOO|nr:Do family serine endopeptidase [Uliginosibacterium sp. H3]
MQRLWLIFAQTVTVALAVLFVISTLRPEWLVRKSVVSASPVSVITQQPISAAPPPIATAGYGEAARVALPSVVHIFTSKEVRTPRHPFLNDPLFRHFFGDNADSSPQRRSSGLGSGVVVSPDGYILTNNHVVEAADEIEVALQDGRKMPAKIVGRDAESDLAVLRIDTPQPLPAITFADSDALHVGDIVLAIGNPFGVGQTVTMGIVSALGRSHLGINTFENFIQTDAAINPGNSGGALVDARGQLVGINTAIYSRSGGSLGIGFAIPATGARKIMDEIIRTGSVTRGWVGVEVQEITPELAASFKLPPQGALIAGVARSSPADKAGVQPGDAMVSVDGQPISNPQSMLEHIASQQPGKSVRFGFVRRGKPLDLSIEIGRRPPPEPRSTAE